MPLIFMKCGIAGPDIKPIAGHECGELPKKIWDDVVNGGYGRVPTKEEAEAYRHKLVKQKQRQVEES